MTKGDFAALNERQESEGKKRFANPLCYDRQTFINRALSSSYSLIESDPGYEAYLAEIGDLFDQNALEGKIVLPQESVAYFKG